MDSDKKPRAFLPPLAAGVGMGLSLMGIFVFTGHGLGASGFFKRVTAWLSDMISPSWTQNNEFLSNFLSLPHPLYNWISFEVGGMAIGAFLGSLLARRFKIKVERGATLGITSRFGFAVLGGILSGFGASLARGCTSGIGLSGGATLSVAAYIFLIGFFVAGLLTAKITKRIW